MWLGLWLWFYHGPAEHPRITAEELALIGADREVKGPALGWGALLKFPQTWAIVLGRFFCDPVWWLYITWLPLYLYKVHGFSLKEIGMFAWAPYVAADAGSLFGGWASGHLMARGWSVDRARKAVIVLGTVCMCCGLFAAASHTAWQALLAIAVVLFGFQAWINNVQTLPSDYFAENAVGSVAGMGGMGAGIGAILFTLFTGFVVDHFSYTPVLIAAGVLPVLGTAVLLGLGGTVRRVA